MIGSIVTVISCTKSAAPLPTQVATDTVQPEWQDMHLPASSRVTCMMQSPSGKIFVGVANIYTGQADFDGTTSLYYSTDTGATWQTADTDHSANINGGAWAIAQDPSNGILLLGCNTYQLNGLFTSSDDGNAWRNNPKPFSPVAFAFLNNQAYMALNNGVSPNPPQYLLGSDNDFNSSWTDCTISDRNWPANPDILITIGDTIWGAAVSVNGLFYTTSPSSGIWTRSDKGITYATSGTSYIICVFENNGWLYAGSTTDGIFLSHDKGTSWSKAASSFLMYVNGFAYNNHSVYAALEDSAVYMTKDNGKTWQPFHHGLPLPLSVKTLISAGNYLLAGTTDGRIYRVKMN